MSYPVGKKTKEEQVGGLAVDGTLDLTEATIHRLVESYMRRMNALHPILNQKEVDKLVDKFLREVKPTLGSGSNQDKRVSISASFVSVPLRKRKYSQDILEQREPPNGPEIGRQLPQRSPSNAVVFTILALGKIYKAQKIPEVS